MEYFSIGEKIILFGRALFFLFPSKNIICLLRVFLPASNKSEKTHENYEYLNFILFNKVY